MRKDVLRKLPLLSGLSDEDLDRLYGMAERVTIPAGGLVMREGEIGDAAYLTLSGLYQVVKGSGKQEMVLDACGSGEVLGEMSLLEQVPRNASVRALTECTALKISQDAFFGLLCASQSAARAILGTVIRRQRNAETMVAQQEKLASLGSLAAGLAHELNNPAAAVQRSADQLQEALTGWQVATLRLAAHGLDQAKLAKLDELEAAVRQRAGQVADLDPLQSSDRQAELESWLDGLGVEEAWELGPALAAADWNVGALEAALAGFWPGAGGQPASSGAAAGRDGQGPAAQADLARWLGASTLAHGLLRELSLAAGQMSEIVKAVKSYAFLDQGPIQLVDVHETLDSTLVILHNRLKQGVKVIRDYAAELPRVEAYGSELNQVWTNLIANAIDAMDGKGELRIHTYEEKGQVVVEISDNGPGISPELRARIFDPFFTTKGPGVGTGLGLHIVQNIVRLKHHGQVQVDSRPGQTTFRIMLPFTLAETVAESASE